MELTALLVFSCLAGSPVCEPDRADVHAVLLPEAACRGVQGAMLVASWAAQNPERRLVSWGCVPPGDVERVIQRVLGINI